MKKVVMRFDPESRGTVFGLTGLLFLVQAAMVFLGYMQVPPIVDLVPDLTNAHALTQEGSWPRKGGVSSYQAVNPAGISFGMTPGAFIFPGNPWLIEKTGSLLLLLLTQWGIVACLYRRIPALFVLGAVALYTFSPGGHFYAESLWPRGHPAFYVWFLFFTLRWVEGHHTRDLAAAIAVWFAGMYWFMEIAPLIGILPILYALYRPPLAWRPLAISAAFCILLWSPYLVLQFSNGFYDVRVNLLERAAPEPINEVFREELTDPDLPVLQGGRPRGWLPTGAVVAPEGDVEADPAAEGRFIADREFGQVWLQTPEQSGFGGRGHYFVLLQAGERWAFQDSETGRLHVQDDGGRWVSRRVGHFVHSQEPLPTQSLLFSRLDVFVSQLVLQNHTALRRPVAFAYGLLLAGMGLWLMACLPASRRRIVLIAHAGLAVVFLLAAFVGAGFHVSPPVLLALGWLLGAAAGNWVVFPQLDKRKRGFLLVLLLAVAVPWVATLAATGADDWAGSGRRFMWLWLGQLVLIASLAGSFWRGSWPQRSVAGGVIGVFLLSAWMSAQTGSKLRRVMAGDFPSQPHPFFQVVDVLGEILREEGRREAAVGYDLSFDHWMGGFRRHNPVYKIGMEFDYTLRARHGIHNLNQTMEGVAATDEFRIVELKPWDPPWDWPLHFDLRDLPTMEIVYEGEKYALLRTPRDAAESPD